MTRRHCRLLVLCIVAGACLPQAKADVVAEFYQGRTVTVVVGSNAAGGYDTFARAVARYTVSYTHLTLPTNREV